MRAFKLLCHNIKIHKLIALFCACVVLSSCGKKSSSDQSLTSFGLSIVIVSGNNQTGGANLLFPNPLRVQVVNSSGDGVKDMQVTFTETTVTNLLLTVPLATTAADGTAQTS